MAENLSTVINRLKLFNESLFETFFWEETEILTKAVDCFDISFVALALKKDALLWTGDKPLTKHLRSLGFDKVLNTEELYQKLITD